MINAFDRRWLAEDGGLERVDRMAKMLGREDRAASHLATKLRITLQARVSGEKAHTMAKAAGREPWQHIA